MPAPVRIPPDRESGTTSRTPPGTFSVSPAPNRPSRREPPCFPSARTRDCQCVRSTTCFAGRPGRFPVLTAAGQVPLGPVLRVSLPWSVLRGHRGPGTEPASTWKSPPAPAISQWAAIRTPSPACTSSSCSSSHAFGELVRLRRQDGPGDQRRRTHMRRLLSLPACVIWCAVTMLPAAVFGQYGATDGEWRTYAGDQGSTKYSPLDQIDATNFNELQIAWRWQSADGTLDLAALRDQRTGVSIRGLQATPLMVDGTLYLSTAMYQAAAIDAGTGDTVWVYDPQVYLRGQPTHGYGSRGVAYWTDGEDERIFWGTSEGYLLGGRRTDRTAGSRLRQQRSRRSHRRHPTGNAWRHELSGAQPPRGQVAAGGPPRRRRRSDDHLGLRCAQGSTTGLVEGDRRAHGCHQVDLPHGAAGRRLRRRHLAERIVALLGQRERVAADERRR